MIYFLYGSDIKISKKKLADLLSALSKKRPNSEIFRINGDNWQNEKFEELLSSIGLFDQKYIVVLDSVLEKKDVKNIVLEKLPDMKVAEHVFLMVESKVDSETLKKIEKYAEKVQESKKIEEKEKYNVFSITYGIINRDKKRLWVDFLKLLDKGIVPEEIHGIIFWQVKNIMLVLSSKNTKDLGLTPYQIKNALDAGKKYNKDEISKMMSDLVLIAEKLRIGEGQTDVMLEKWILSL